MGRWYKTARVGEDAGGFAFLFFPGQIPESLAAIIDGIRIAMPHKMLVLAWAVQVAIQIAIKPIMRFEKTKSAGYLANHMARLFAHGLQQRIAPLGIAPAQFMTLLELWENDAITQRQLVEKLDVEQATMANTLNRMQRDGLIEKKPHPIDKRAQVICLTPKAKAVQSDSIAAAKAINKQALSGLSDEERKQFLAFMHTVITSMKKETS